MIAAVRFRMRKFLFLAVLFLVFSAFTADILDLREELLIISSSPSSLDDNVTTGIVSDFDFATKPILQRLSIPRKTSLEISFSHRLPCGFRAPPSRT